MAATPLFLSKGYLPSVAGTEVSKQGSRKTAHRTLEGKRKQLTMAEQTLITKIGMLIIWQASRFTTRGSFPSNKAAENWLHEN